MTFEGMLDAYEKAYGLNFISLRYFNAAGADPEGKVGEDHRPETHLIPLLLQTALGLRDRIQLFGTDYPTSDGTCIRDYIHVADLSQAHLLALDALNRGIASTVYNLGNGNGYSNRQVIAAVQQVTGGGDPGGGSAAPAWRPRCPGGFIREDPGGIGLATQIPAVGGDHCHRLGMAPPAPPRLRR